MDNKEFPITERVYALGIIDFTIVQNGTTFYSQAPSAEQPVPQTIPFSMFRFELPKQITVETDFILFVLAVILLIALIGTKQGG